MRIYKQSGGIGVPSESFYLISAGGMMYSIEETQFHSNGNGNATIERYNIPDLGYEDQHKEINYQIQDHLGNLRLSYTVLHCPSCSEQNCATVDVQYQINYIAEYLAYGGLLREFVRNGTSGEKFLSTGHERDKQTSWDYRQARYYDADIGRFLAVDPLASYAPSWSPYRYAFDNPISITDPTGLFETKGDAREWAKENGIRIGWFSSWKLVDNGESGFAIENRKKGTRYYRDGIDNAQLSLNPDGVTVEALVSGNKSVGEPGTLESMIPIWGSGRNAVNEFQNGNIDLGLMHTALAISDVFLVKSIATGIGKGAWKLGSHSWGATRKWLGKKGYAKKGQHVHHWAVHQATAKKYGLESVTNQPWNLMPMSSPALHQSIHGVGPNAFGIMGQFWYGTPTWFKAGIFSGAGRIIN